MVDNKVSTWIEVWKTETSVPDPKMGSVRGVETCAAIVVGMHGERMVWSIDRQIYTCAQFAALDAQAPNAWKDAACMGARKRLGVLSRAVINSLDDSNVREVNPYSVQPEKALVETSSELGGKRLHKVLRLARDELLGQKRLYRTTLAVVFVLALVLAWGSFELGRFGLGEKKESQVSFAAKSTAALVTNKTSLNSRNWSIDEVQNWTFDQTEEWATTHTNFTPMVEAAACKQASRLCFDLAFEKGMYLAMQHQDIPFYDMLEEHPEVFAARRIFIRYSYRGLSPLVDKMAGKFFEDFEVVREFLREYDTSELYNSVERVFARPFSEMTDQELIGIARFSYSDPAYPELVKEWIRRGDDGRVIDALFVSVCDMKSKGGRYRPSILAARDFLARYEVDELKRLVHVLMKILPHRFWHTPNELEEYLAIRAK